MAILNIFSSISANTARENYSQLTEGLCNNYLEERGGGGGCKYNGGPKVKLWCWVVGGLDVNLLNTEGGLQVILMFKWHIIYSNSNSLLLNDF